MSEALQANEQRIFGVNTHHLRQSLSGIRDLEYLAGKNWLPGKAEAKLDTLEQYAPLLNSLIGELNGGPQTTVDHVALNLPLDNIRESMPGLLKPLAAPGSRLLAKLALNSARTIMEDETGQAWVSGLADRAEPYVQSLEFENPQRQAVKDVVNFLASVQGIARAEAAKSRGEPTDPNNPDRGVKPEHVAIGLQTMMLGILDRDPQIAESMPLFAKVADKLLPKDTEELKSKVPPLWKLKKGAHAVIGALNDILPKEYRNLQLQKDAWQFNMLARTVLFFTTGPGALGAVRETAAATISHAIMALPASGEETQAPFRTLRQKFPTVVPQS